jgi:hypothetical protein
VRVGKHPLGNVTETNEVVAQGAREVVAVLLGELAATVVERVRVMGGNLLVDDVQRSLAPVLTSEVNLLGGKHLFDSLPDRFGRRTADLLDCAHRCHTTSSCS